MSGLIDFFSGISTQERSLILVSGLVFLITAETLAPQINMNYKSCDRKTSFTYTKVFEKEKKKQNSIQYTYILYIEVLYF